MIFLQDMDPFYCIHYILCLFDTPHTITTFRLQSWDHRSALCEEVPTLSVDRDGFEDLFLWLEDAQLNTAWRNSFGSVTLSNNINLIFS